jgi:hypothetical protein
VKKSICVTAILLAFLLLSGCAAKNETDASMQSASGGNANAAEHINLKDIDIATDADDTVVTLSFLSGSRNSDYPESKLISLPEYSISQLPSPQRIMITLNDISYCDYTAKDSWALSAFLRGVFQETPASGNKVILYLQLSREAKFTVEESEGDLIIRLTPAAAQETPRFYCVSNAFYAHQEGAWPADIDMTPVLCSDLKNLMLISQPFETLEAAESYRDSVSAELQTALPGVALSIVELSPGALPDYTALDYSTAQSKTVIFRNGVASAIPLLLQNGRYLATAKDGTIAFSRSYRMNEPALEQEANLNSDALWILDTAGHMKILDASGADMIFSMIDSAQFSYDGRYIGLLDVSIEDSILYVYDFKTDTLLNLGEEGFGNQTVTYAWSDTENRLYAMTGDAGKLQLQACAFAEDGNITIGAVEERAGAMGRLAVSQGELYFADNSVGMIYRIDETRTAITAGADFRISPDGACMAILQTNVADEEQVLTSLSCYDIVTGKSAVIAENADIASFGFSADGRTVLFTDGGIGDEAADDFPFGLFAFDAATCSSTMIALCSTGDMVPAAPGTVYLIQYFNDAENSFYATYQYDFGQ